MTHPIAPPRRRAAFSLIEVMFAIAILGLGLIAIAALFPVGLVQQKRAWDDANGVIVGQNVLAMVQAYVADRGTAAAPFNVSQSRFSILTEPAGFPTYADPAGTYDYRLAYRYPAGGALEVAVFVFRKPRSGTPATASDLLATDIVGGQTDKVYRRGFVGAQKPGQIVRSAGALFERPQVVLAQHSTNAAVPAYVLSVIQESPTNLVREAPDIPASTGLDYTDEIIWAPDKAVAIVMGVVQ